MSAEPAHHETGGDSDAAGTDYDNLNRHHRRKGRQP